ncbi:MAG: hypothetical protein ACLP7J_28185 [Streptosporangiaceae bacterium]
MATSNDGKGTGPKPASDAGKLLRNPKTPKKVKDVRRFEAEESGGNPYRSEVLSQLGSAQWPDICVRRSPIRAGVRSLWRSR